MRRTVAVLGPGAVGGTFAARFLQADYRTICVAPPATVGLMALSGISFEANGNQPLVVRPEVAERLVQPVSLLLVTVKAPISRTRSSGSSPRRSRTASCSRC